MKPPRKTRCFAVCISRFGSDLARPWVADLIEGSRSGMFPWSYPLQAPTSPECAVGERNQTRPLPATRR